MVLGFPRPFWFSGRGLKVLWFRGFGTSVSARTSVLPYLSLNSGFLRFNQWDAILGFGLRVLVVQGLSGS